MSKTDALIELITQEIIGFIMIDNNLDIDDAMNLFYNSVIFDNLLDIETGLYLEGSAYIYELMKPKPSVIV